ncbi:MAG: hypothetical protein ACRD1R_10365 [Acidobacteriota bacterium]
MRTNTTPLTILLILFLAGCSGENRTVSRETTATLGEKRIQILVHEVRTGEPLFFNMHDNENTAVEAALVVIEKRGGRVLELRHSGERMISFDLNETTYTFDPNRIFTDEGARKTLQEQGPFSDQALVAVRKFANQLLDNFGLVEAEMILTVHNNTDGQYSARSYLEGGEYESEAAAVHLQAGSDPDDFFFVTDEELFYFFQERGFNVVLQDNAAMTNDGSLSVFAGHRGIPYINIEAEHGHLDRQLRLLEAVYRLMDRANESRQSHE